MSQHIRRRHLVLARDHVSVDSSLYQPSSGFTIVELLVVIVVIGILAAITIVSYSGITAKATLSAVQSDLSSAATQLKSYSITYGSFPTALDGSNCPTAPTTDSNYCLKASNGNALSYSHIAGKTFHLTATKGSTSYSINDNTAPAIATTANGSSVGLACPADFIPVPGSGTYGTNDFCVMKFEAKNVAGVATSQAASTPWVSISQATAITTAAAACTGCHLITEAEWLTIAQNVLSVASNWSGGAVGSGYIYSGHNDNAPSNALAISSTSDNYSDTGNTSPSNQRRTLTLNNSETIWDLAGNVWEWTNGTTSGGQPGITGEAAYAWKQWISVTTPGSLSPNPNPTTTGISGACCWTSGNGIGQLYSYVGETGLRGFGRSGGWNNNSNAGLLALYLYRDPSYTDTSLGFRVSL